jgi:hypothetical protein
MNVEIGAEAAQFPEKEYINGIAVAVQLTNQWILSSVTLCCSIEVLHMLNIWKVAGGTKRQQNLILVFGVNGKVNFCYHNNVFLKNMFNYLCTHYVDRYPRKIKALLIVNFTRV